MQDSIPHRDWKRGGKELWSSGVYIRCVIHQMIDICLMWGMVCVVSLIPVADREPFSLEPPYFVTELEPLEASVGDSVSLQCQVAGPQKLQCLWYKAIPSYGDSEYRYFTNNVATLVLIVNINDSGEYTCKAENSIGTASSKTVFRIQGDDFVYKLRNLFFLILHLTLWGNFCFTY